MGNGLFAKMRELLVGDSLQGLGPDGAGRVLKRKTTDELLTKFLRPALAENEELSAENLRTHAEFQRSEEEKVLAARDRGDPSPEPGRIEDFPAAITNGERVKNRTWPLESFSLISAELMERYAKEGLPVGLKKLAKAREEAKADMGAALLLQQETRRSYGLCGGGLAAEAACIEIAKRVDVAGQKVRAIESEMLNEWGYRVV